jgi:hypothetical protein
MERKSLIQKPRASRQLTRLPFLRIRNKVSSKSCDDCHPLENFAKSGEVVGKFPGYYSGRGEGREGGRESS